MGYFARFGAFLDSARSPGRAVGRALVLGAYRFLAAGGIAAVVLELSGCYTYVPHQISELPRGAVVSAEITDEGRVALVPQMGSEVGQLEGQVLQQSDSVLRLTVSEVRFISGLSNHWQGQEVTLRPQDVKSLSQRTYSKQRSVFAAIAIGGLIALAIGGAIFTGLFSGDSNPDKGGGGPPPVS